MPQKRMLVYFTGEIEESLLLRIEYLIEERTASCAIRFRKECSRQMASDASLPRRQRFSAD